MILHYFGATKSLWSQIFAHYASAHESRGNSASGQLVCCGCNINICWCWSPSHAARDLLPHSVYCLRVSTGQISAAGLWVEQCRGQCSYTRTIGTPATALWQCGGRCTDRGRTRSTILPNFVRFLSWSQIEPTLSSNHSSFYFCKNSS